MQRLDKHFKTLTHAAFARHGFAKAEIVNQWPAIAGDKLARSAAPVRVQWPRQSPGSQKTGGTLIVRIEPALALDLQYAAPRVIERINGYFGYAAIDAIRIVQGRVANADRQPPRQAARDDAKQRQQLRARLSGIDDPGLQDALARLGAGIDGQRQKPPRS